MCFSVSLGISNLVREDHAAYATTISRTGPYSSRGDGFEKAHVELQLAHANDDKTEAAYNHVLYVPERTTMM